MSILTKDPITVNVSGSDLDVTKIFLQIFLARQKLTGRELDVAASLVSRYSKLVKDGVNEPYASIILFSTDSRKEITEELDISSAHLQNTLTPLQSKNVIAKDKLILNPALIPPESITFKFTINGEQG